MKRLRNRHRRLKIFDCEKLWKIHTLEYTATLSANVMNGRTMEKLGKNM